MRVYFNNKFLMKSWKLHLHLKNQNKFWANEYTTVRGALENGER